MIGPAVDRGRLVAVMTEEWQTAGFTQVLSDELYRRGLRDRCVMLWKLRQYVHWLHRLHPCSAKRTSGLLSVTARRAGCYCLSSFQ